jgi:hypothetical protein
LGIAEHNAAGAAVECARLPLEDAGEVEQRSVAGNGAAKELHGAAKLPGGDQRLREAEPTGVERRVAPEHVLVQRDGAGGPTGLAVYLGEFEGVPGPARAIARDGALEQRYAAGTLAASRTCATAVSSSPSGTARR